VRHRTKRAAAAWYGAGPDAPTSGAFVFSGAFPMRGFLLLIALIPGLASAQAPYCRIAEPAPAQCAYATQAACDDAVRTQGGTCAANPATAAAPAAAPTAGGTAYDFDKPVQRHVSGEAYAGTYARGSSQRRANHEANLQKIQQAVARIQAERGGDASTEAAAPAADAAPVDPERFRCRSPNNAIRYAPEPIAGYRCEDLAPAAAGASPEPAATE
jgi:hypothetical protein